MHVNYTCVRIQTSLVNYYRGNANAYSFYLPFLSLSAPSLLVAGSDLPLYGKNAKVVVHLDFLSSHAETKFLVLLRELTSAMKWV